MKVVVIVAAVCFALPAFAQTAPPAKPATAAAKPAKAANPPNAAARPAASKSIYEMMAVADRIALQSDLVWTGVLNGTANGEWGPLSVAAIKAFQKRKGGKETGTLTPEERMVLAADAKAKQDVVGWRLVNDASGARLGIPGKLLPQATKGRSGGHWQSSHGEAQIDVFREPPPATLNVVYTQMRKDPIRQVEYSVIKPDFFVLSGLQGLKRFYIRAQAGKGEVRGVTVLYDQAMQGTMEPVVVMISSAFNPFPTTVQATAGAPAKPIIEYATGVLVSAAGDIVTDRDAIDGCQVIVANGLGNAERVADDKSSGLALVRVYGALGVKPLPLGEGARGDLTLVGIADPQAQGGNAAASTMKVRVASGNGGGTFDPALTPGFAGAAAIDSDGGFAGIAVQRAQVVAGPATSGGSSSLAPVDAIRKMLTAEHVTFLSGKASADAARESALRVICVRK